MTSEEAYAKLKVLESPEKVDPNWPRYQELDFKTEDVEFLLEFIADYYLKMEQTDEESSVSIHAWRVLAAMKDLEHLSELINLSFECELIDDDWFASDFAKLMGHFGMSALPELLEVVKGAPASELAMGFCEALEKMVGGEEDRLEAIAVLVDLLDREQFDRDFRGFVVSALVKFKAVDHLDKIREQFEGNRVNISINGDLEDAEIGLGVRETRETPLLNLFEEESKLAQKEKDELAGPFPKGGSLEEKLQYFLIRHGRNDSIRAVDELDGFLFALLISGIEMEKEQLSDLVWSPTTHGQGGSPSFANEAEKKEWLQSLLELYVRIEQGMVEENYIPHLSIWPDAEQSMDPEVPYFTPWLEGFMTGDGVIAGGQENDLENGPTPGFLAMEMLLQEEDGLRLLEDDEKNPFFSFMGVAMEKYHAREMWTYGEISPDESSLDEGLWDVESGFKDFAGATPAPEKKVKTERNSPCPCGSGLKYKKCCMN